MKQVSKSPRNYHGWTVINETGPVAGARIASGQFYGLFETREQAEAARDQIGYGLVVEDSVLVFSL